MLKLIDPKDRKKCRCHFCGTNLSVKYLVEIYDPVISNEKTFVCVCNKCAAFYKMLAD